MDGSIEMLDSWFDPQGQGDMSDLLAENRRQTAAADALLCGRNTYEALRGYWRDLTDDSTGISEYLNHVNKYVVSTTLTRPEWGNTTVLSGNPVDEVRALKRQKGSDIVLTGSISLTHELVLAGLIDEYRLFIYPVVQGRGRRLFPEGYKGSNLHLLSSMSFRSGISLLVYTTS